MDMKQKITLFCLLVMGSLAGFGQGVQRIETPQGIRYITNSMDYPVAGTYHYRGAEPVVELNSGGSGYYQHHDLEKRPIIWGIECDESGVAKFVKGFDNAAYTLWYQYTTRTDVDTDENMAWKPVGFSVHFNSQKMFIQGERSKSYGGDAER